MQLSSIVSVRQAVDNSIRRDCGDGSGVWRKNMEFFDLGTIIFLVAAVVIFIQLRNVLGRRTGNERPPFDPYTAGRKRVDAEPAAQDNVVSLPRRKAGEPAE